MKMSLTEDNVPHFLRNTAKGRLKYDRNWLEEGRAKDLLQYAPENLSKLSLNFSLQGLANLHTLNELTTETDHIEKAESVTKSEDSCSEISLESLSNSFSSSPDNSINNLSRSNDGNLIECELDVYLGDDHRTCNRVLDYEENRKKEVETKLKSRQEALEGELKLLSQDSNRQAMTLKQNLMFNSKRKQLLIAEIDRMQLEEMMEQHQEMIEMENKNAKRLQERMKYAEQKNKDMQRQAKEQLSRLESLKKIKLEFRIVVNTVSQLLQTCKHQEHLVAAPQTRQERFKMLESQLELIELKNRLTLEDLQQADSVLDGAKLLYNEIGSDIANALSTAQRLAIQASAASKQDPQPVTEAKQTQEKVPGKLPTKSFEQVNEEEILFKELFDMHKSWQESYKEFLNDINLKKYRFDLQKAINTPVNAISSISGSHARDKFERLTYLLLGRPVVVGSKTVSIHQHPHALNYSADLLAKTIVNQAERNVSSNHEAAFPLAALTISLWCEFPKIGELVLAHLIARCPYLSPRTLPRTIKMTDDSLKSLGYLIIDGESEDQEQFLKRMSGMVRFYGALLQTPPYPALKCTTHPHGLGHGWRLLVRLLAVTPIPDITPTVLFDFLEVCGSAMAQTYGRQFQKVLHILCKDYFQAIKDVTPNGVSGPLTRLEVFLQSSLRRRTIPPPPGLITQKFWYT